VLAPHRAGTLTLRARIVAIGAILLLFNAGAWLWALAALGHSPKPLALAFMIYGLGLRHAVDADHIAAIDNVTRKLMQDGRRPVTVGFWFAIGHSIIVFCVTAAVAGASTMLGRFQSFQELGSTISTSVSAVFLFAIATINVFIFASIYQNFRRVRAGHPYMAEEMSLLLNSVGPLSRLLRPLFRLMTRSWHMMLLGIVFGLSFDTATEIAMFSFSATQAANGVPLMTLLVYPLLFAAGMSLLDTTDGVMMLGAYQWAFVKPMRKLYYNMTITLMSVVVAVLIGGIELLGLVKERFGMTGLGWNIIGLFSHNLNNCGFVVIAVFVAVWGGSYILYQSQRLDDLEICVTLERPVDQSSTVARPGTRFLVHGMLHRCAIIGSIGRGAIDE
jgi:nickel/cobalt transporter (NiCoT) family protein